jgi:hypothetical protein
LLRVSTVGRSPTTPFFLFRFGVNKSHPGRLVDTAAIPTYRTDSLACGDCADAVLG